MVGREPSEPRNANACVFPWQIARLKVLATAVTIRRGGRVEIHTESWVDEAGSYRFQSVVVHEVETLSFESINRLSVSMYHKAMSRRRSRLEIMLIILSAVRDGVDKPTRIMFSAKMSWDLTQRILSSLVEQGLLELMVNTYSRQSKKRYVITERGSNVLDYFERAREMLPLEAI